MISPPRAILFDWDNTLIDSFAVIHAALAVTQRAMGVQPWTLEETRQRTRLSLRDHFPLLFGARWEEAMQIFYAAFQDLHLQRLEPMAGAEDTLRALAGRVPLAVVSNKTGLYLRREAEHLGWSKLFHRLVGATDAPRDKPAREPVELALQGTGIAPGAEVWFVGDNEIDVECAQNAGCTAILVRQEPPVAGEFATALPALHVCEITDLAPLVIPR